MYDIHLVTSTDYPPKVLAMVREGHSPNGEWALCEIGSRCVREFFDTLPYGGADVDGYRGRCAQRFQESAAKLQRILDMHAAELDPHGARQYGVYAADRAEAACPSIDGSRELAEVNRIIDRE